MKKLLPEKVAILLAPERKQIKACREGKAINHELHKVRFSTHRQFHCSSKRQNINFAFKLIKWHAHKKVLN